MREHLPADFLLTNHVLLGAPVGAAVGMPYTVKAHGSELEFSMRGNEELCAWARESLGPAAEVIAGSEHIRAVLAEVVGWTERVRIVPPGVDVEEFRPAPRDVALAALLRGGRSRLCRRPRSEIRTRATPSGLRSSSAGRRRPSSTSGSSAKRRACTSCSRPSTHVDARAVVVGFGPARDELERAAGERVLFTGALEHRHLRHLWPLADVSVTPSVFPEAFGMVAAEAAACGSPPLVARHSGLAEVAEGLEAAYPEEHRALASFEPGTPPTSAAKLEAILALPALGVGSALGGRPRSRGRALELGDVAALILSPRG